MAKPAEIVAALGDISGIESHATLQVDMVDLFNTIADCMKDRNDQRSAQIMRKMAATIETVPYDMLTKFNYNYDGDLFDIFLILRVLHADVPDYIDAHALVLTLLDEMRSIDLDHPNTKKALEMVNPILESIRRQNPRSPPDR